MRNHLAALALLLLAACAGPTPYQNADITGTVSWSERVTYGPDATLYVYLVDASGPDSPLQVELQKLDNPEPGAELEAATTIEGMIPSPTRFSLVVPLDQVDQGHDYALKAAIVDQGKPVMATSNAPLVLTKGRPTQVELTLAPVPMG
ncbi:MAG: YbaY family lipoprotein [Geminicoccaceae bacterium]